MENLANSPFGREPHAIDELPKVVVAYATYQKATTGVPNESSLAHPIQALLKGSWRIYPEQNHPTLKQNQKAGRPWQIDFVGKKGQRWSFALEVKIHDGAKPDRLIRDVVKLLLLGDSPESKNALRYLLVLFPRPSEIVKEIPDSGHEPLLTQKMYGAIGTPPVDLFNQLLPWKSPSQELVLGRLDLGIRKHVDTALLALGRPAVRGDIKIELLAKDWSDDFACGLWKFLWRSPQVDYSLSKAAQQPEGEQ
ncbi:hypothetical protein [Bradyrhizobium diazoefficiens]|uniref:Uncharacterized protein n=1 Tax=Bradyrhizobium diazoefficiens TaxID=1355477 RepID=A0A809Y9V3_9BRAD|nr:hypothetical protein [Bradyrhizobium diazoefficiens]BBZ99846.1 hypothetical protein H12S4_07510 [Bradyrhizobium diazoefficiens]BCA17531.1 hypothetical protein BDHH15_07460 [Bradyrhizobium diazoefficiens]BCE35715.1 hypothetical protein XF3B_07460 [Bradyrhizobium diazoefficiens]BCF49108.1 hypothetical protein XF17B_07460 [Bradyrhizobium diazoefficiens]